MWSLGKKTKPAVLSFVRGKKTLAEYFGRGRLNADNKSSGVKSRPLAASASAAGAPGGEVDRRGVQTAACERREPPPLPPPSRAPPVLL